MLTFIKESIDFLDRETKEWQKYFLATFFTTLLYFFVGRFGFSLSLTGNNITPVFFPAGIAISLILIFGIRRIATGVFLGSFLMNLWAFYKIYDPAKSIIVSFLIAGGSLLQGCLGAHLLEKYVGKNFTKIFDLFKTQLISIIICFISSTWAVANMCAFGFVNWEDFPYSWLIWYLGDLAGILIILPLFMCWKVKKLSHWNLDGFLEFFILLMITVSLSQLICEISRRYIFGLIFLLIPLVTWAALRFCQFIVSLLFFTSLMIFIFKTFNGNGFVYNINNNITLLLVQFHVIVIWYSILTLCIAIDNIRKLNICHCVNYRD